MVHNKTARARRLAQLTYLTCKKPVRKATRGDKNGFESESCLLVYICFLSMALRNQISCGGFIVPIPIRRKRSID